VTNLITPGAPFSPTYMYLLNLVQLTIWLKGVASPREGMDWEGWKDWGGVERKERGGKGEGRGKEGYDNPLFFISAIEFSFR